MQLIWTSMFHAIRLRLFQFYVQSKLIAKQRFSLLSWCWWSQQKFTKRFIRKCFVIQVQKPFQNYVGYKQRCTGRSVLGEVPNGNAYWANVQIRIILEEGADAGEYFKFIINALIRRYRSTKKWGHSWNYIQTVCHILRFQTSTHLITDTYFTVPGVQIGCRDYLKKAL